MEKFRKCRFADVGKSELDRSLKIYKNEYLVRLGVTQGHWQCELEKNKKETCAKHIIRSTVHRTGDLVTLTVVHHVGFLKRSNFRASAVQSTPSVILPKFVIAETTADRDMLIFKFIF